MIFSANLNIDQSHVVICCAVGCSLGSRSCAILLIQLSLMLVN